MLFSKEMEGVGILRFSLTDQRVVYCLKDLCQLLGIKYSNRLRGELNNKFVYSLTVKDEGKPVKMLFIDIGNLNTVVQIAGTTSKSELTISPPTVQKALSLVLETTHSGRLATKVSLVWSAIGRMTNFGVAISAPAVKSVPPDKSP